MTKAQSTPLVFPVAAAITQGLADALELLLVSKDTPEVLARANRALEALRSAEPVQVPQLPEGWVPMPAKPMQPIISAMLGSEARDDEGSFQPLCDLIGFSGDNKNHTVMNTAYEAAVAKAGELYQALQAPAEADAQADAPADPLKVSASLVVGTWTVSVDHASDWFWSASAEQVRDLATLGWRCSTEAGGTSAQLAQSIAYALRLVDSELATGPISVQFDAPAVLAWLKANRKVAWAVGFCTHHGAALGPTGESLTELWYWRHPDPKLVCAVGYNTAYNAAVSFEQQLLQQQGQCVPA